MKKVLQFNLMIIATLAFFVSGFFLFSNTKQTQTLVYAASNTAEPSTSFVDDEAFQDMYQKIFGTTYNVNDYKIIYLANERYTGETALVVGESWNLPATSLKEAYALASGKNLIIYMENDYVLNDVTYAGYDSSDLTAGWITNNTTNRPAIIYSQRGSNVNSYANYQLKFYDDWHLSGNTGFYNVTIGVTTSENYVNTQIYCNGYTAVFGGLGKANCTCHAQTGKLYPTLFGGAETGTVASTNLYVYGGTYARIYGAGDSDCVVTGNTNLNIDGRVYMADGTTIKPKTRSVSISSNGYLNNLYSEGTGGYVTAGGPKSTLTSKESEINGDTNLNINYWGYNPDEYMTKTGLGVSDIRVVAGIIGGKISVNINNSCVSQILDSYGSCDDIEYDIKNSFVSTAYVLYIDNSSETNVAYNMSYENCHVGNSIGNQNASANYAVININFKNCRIRTFGDVYTTRVNPINVVFDSCEFKTQTYYNYNKTTNLTFKNIHDFATNEPQEIRLTNSQSYYPTCEDGIAFYNYADQSVKQNLIIENTTVRNVRTASFTNLYNTLTIGEGAKYILGDNANLTVYEDLIGVQDASSTNKGQLLVGDGVRIAIKSMTSGSYFVFGTEDESAITTRSMISLNLGSSSYDANTFESGLSDGTTLNYIPTHVSSGAFWYISKEQLTLKENLIYIDQDNGNDANLGTSDAPVQSIERAYALIEAENGARTTLMFVSTYNLISIAYSSSYYYYNFPKLTDKSLTLTYTFNDGINDFSSLATLHFANPTTDRYSKVELYNNAIFEDISLTKTENNTRVYYFYVEGKNFSATTGVNVCSSFYLRMYGAEASTGYNAASEGFMLNLQSGQWYCINVEGTFGYQKDANGVLYSETNTNPNNIITMNIGGQAGFSTMTINAKIYGGITLDVDGNCGTPTANATSINFVNGKMYGPTNVNIGGVFTGTGNWISNRLISASTFYDTVDMNLGINEGDKLIMGLSVTGVFYKKANFVLGKYLTENQSSSYKYCKIGKEYSTAAFEIYNELNISFHQHMVSTNISTVGIDETLLMGSLNLKFYAGCDEITFAHDGTISFFPVNAAFFSEDGETSVSTLTKYQINGKLEIKDAIVTINESVTLPKIVLNNATLTVVGKLNIYDTGGDGNLTLSNNSNLIVSDRFYLASMQGQGHFVSDGTSTINLYGTPSEEYVDRHEIEVVVSNPIKLSTIYTQVNPQKLYVPKTSLNSCFLGADENIQIQITDLADCKLVEFWTINIIEYVYVNGTSGNDNNDGLTVGNAVATLERAFNIVSPNQTIIICGDTTVTSWPSNALIPVHITSYDAENNTSYYSSTVTTTFTMPTTTYLQADTWFECLYLKVTSESAIYAEGHDVTFGLAAQDFGVLTASTRNLTTNGVIRVYGATSLDQLGVTITLNSGSLRQVSLTHNVTGTYGTQETSDEVLGTFVMTGGYVNGLSLSYNYTKLNNTICGTFVANLSGGYIGNIGHYGRIGEYTNYIYNMSDSFYFVSFYLGTYQSGGSYSQHTNVVLNADSCSVLTSYTGATISCGAIYESIYGTTTEHYYGTFTANLTNTTIDKIYGGGAVSHPITPSAVGTSIINLNENATITNLYLGAQYYQSLQTLIVNINDDSAGITHVYNHGLGNTLQTPDVQIVINTGTCYDFGTAFDTCDDTCSMLHKIVVGTAQNPSSVQISTLLASNIGTLVITPNSIAFLQSGATYGGGIQGADSNSSSDKSYLLLANGARLTFNGEVSGYLTLITGLPSETGISKAGLIYTVNENGFKNGLTIYGGSCNMTDPENAFIPENTAYVPTYTIATICWSCSDSEDTVYRNVVYVSQNGADSGSGSYGSPVLTLAGAYAKVVERYNIIKALPTTQEFTEYLKESKLSHMTIKVLDSVVLGDFSLVDMTIMISDDRTVLINSSSYGTDNTNIEFSDDSNAFPVPIATKFYYVTFTSNCNINNPTIYGQGNELWFWDVVQTESVSNLGFTLYGGAETANITTKGDLVVLGGDWQTIYAGGEYGAIDVTGAENPYATSLIIGDHAVVETAYSAGHYASATATGSVYVYISGGNIGKFYGGGEFGAVTGKIVITFTDGEIDKFYGGGKEATATADSVEIVIGSNWQGEIDSAKITTLFRGGGEKSAFVGANSVSITIYANAQLGTSTQDISFCAGGYAGNIANTYLTINGGTFYGDVYGGGFGIDANDTTIAEALKESYGIVGNTEITMTGGVIYGNLFGGGNNGLVTTNSHVIVNGGSVNGNIYGGGNSAGVYNTLVDVTVPSTAIISANIYGGSYNITRTQRDIQTNSTVRLYGGNINGQVFGGSNLNGNIASTTAISIYNSTIATGAYGGGNMAMLTGNTSINIDGNFTGNVFGGGKGDFVDEIFVDANVSETNITINGTITGNIYGGGELASVGDINETASTYVTNITVNNNANIIGKVYGGGKGLINTNYAIINGSTNVVVNGGNITSTDNSETSTTGFVFGGGEIAPVTGNTNVTISGGTISNVFAGNDQTGTIAGSTNVTISGGSVEHVYGAGKDASYSGTGTNVVISNGTLTDVYGGGYGLTATVTTGNITISGGTISNIYGGGNAAPTTNANITISSGNITNVYGGGYGSTATTTDAVTTITDGTISTVYGGGNAATVTNSATVNVNITGPTQHIDTIFAGNNQADMSIQPTLNIQDGVIGEVYGGGNQGAMTKSGGISYTFNDADIEITTLYGGCKNANVADGVTLNISEGTFGTIFGGNNVNGNPNTTTVNYSGNAVVNTLYGGNNAGGNPTQTNLNVSGGIINTAVYGGNYSAGNPQETNVSITGGTINGDVYGGNNAGGDPLETNVIISAITITGDVYGGNNQAGNPTTVYVTINDGTFSGIIYGGNNAGGTVGTTYVIINKNLNEVYGGNNKSGSVTTTNVTINKPVTTVYGGNNQGGSVGTTNVIFNCSDTNTSTIYGGNNAGGTVTTTNVTINQPTSTVYGGNYQNGSVSVSNVTINADTTTVYGGNNEGGTIDETNLLINSGTISNIYGGGNAVTVDNEVNITVGTATQKPIITNLYCGNNQADMSICPIIDLKNATITNFYGGGNEGQMLCDLSYDFTNSNVTITNLFGGSNQANVVGNITLNFAGTNVNEVYGGCNTSGTVSATTINVCGNGLYNIYGGGKGENTSILTTNINVQNGTITGNIYGGSGLGYVGESNILIQESSTINNAKVIIQGNIYGAGYGVSSITETTNVVVNLNLNIKKSAISSFDSEDIGVVETALSTIDDVPSGEIETTLTWRDNRENEVSVINGSVFGGGDMGKVGDGVINTMSNTAKILTIGSTNVTINNGYIKGSVFGGGNGQPAIGISYTNYMGTVFGCSNTNVYGGFIKGSVYGCGNQSRAYAVTNGDVSNVRIIEQSNHKAIVLGASVFGGGNKGESANTNASVYTSVGNTNVLLSGIENNTNPTTIYFLTKNTQQGILGGGLYGDGNLCLVFGTRNVVIKDVNYGADKETLKTFYSLQRSDNIDLIRTRVVLKGALDLVDANATETLYSINRVEILNMKESSTTKIVDNVNLLAEIVSDEQTDRHFIDNGSKGGDATPLTDAEISTYRTEYENYLLNQETSISFNILSVANGTCVNVMSGSAEYGAVKGLFMLELVYANPGQGGGFVYADIPTSTGDFICTTKIEEESSEYMNVVSSKGGATQSGFSYYYWYIQGSRYNYDLYLNGYIGTMQTSFDETCQITDVQNGYSFILRSLTGVIPLSSSTSTAFNVNCLKSDWQSSYNSGNFYAIEMQIVTFVGVVSTTENIGFLHYDQSNQIWGIKKTNSVVITGSNGDAEKVVENTFYTISSSSITSVEIKFILHKGTGVDFALKDVLNTIEIDSGVVTQYSNFSVEYKTNIKINTYTSITRIIPSQSVYLSSGKMYAGVISDAQISITSISSYTVQFVTHFVPSVYKIGNNFISEYFSVNLPYKYLIDANGVGYTITEENNVCTLVYVSSGNKNEISIVKENGNYYAKQGEIKTSLSMSSSKTSTTAYLPAGTKILLIAQIDDYQRTYWYYYCNSQTNRIDLTDFYSLSSLTTQSDRYTFAKASGNQIDENCSNYITQNFIFIVDFSETIMTEDISGNVGLEHQYETDNGTADVMDYILTSVVEEEISYTRKTPAMSNDFVISSGNGIQVFEVEMEDEIFSANDEISIIVTLQEDQGFTNTEYIEQEYSVTLRLKNSNDEYIKFSTGTEFVYDGETYALSNNSYFVVIPVLIAGEHTITMKNPLKDFAIGNYVIVGELHSSVDALYYVSHTKCNNSSFDTFEISGSSTYALDVEFISTSSIVEALQTLNIQLTKSGDETDVNVSAYRLNNGAYESINLSDIFTTNTTTISITGSSYNWTPIVKQDVSSGYYRLEFVYVDKIAYLDIIVL